MANLYVGNLSYETTEEQVRQLFTEYGQVDSVNLITDRDTGRLRGFGFVEMSDAAGAKSAIAGLNGKDIAGRALTVNEARPKTGRGGYGGGGGDRGRSDGGRRW